jgi:serine protease Do
MMSSGWGLKPAAMPNQQGRTRHMLRPMTLVTALGCLLSFSCAPQAAVGPPGGGLETLDFRQVVSQAKDKVFPAVVFILCLKETHESGEKITQEMAGSGVIVSPTGEVLTNWHVVDKTTEIRCLLYDGRHMDASIVGTDKDTDLALLQLKTPGTSTAPATAPAGLPFAALGDSTVLKEGNFVMAMGAPWGLSRSVSIGIVACTRRYLPEQSEYSLWLQTDASISPGNSGGPLINTQGQIVGITTLGALFGGDLGFAVPSETIRSILPQLREHHRVNWSWTGLQLQPLKDFNKNIYFEGSEGVVVAETDPESPARRAGIQPRDRILKVNDKPLVGVWEEDLPAVRRELGLLAKYQAASFQLLRDNRPVTLEVTPREKGKVEGEELDCPRWDLTVKTINQFDNPDVYFYHKKGVFIFGVKYPGNASSAGLQPKDIILSIEGKQVSALEEVKEMHKAALDNIKTKHRLMFGLLRNGLMRQLVLDFERDYQKE